jgi:thioesterase domain-containing protein
MTSALFDEGDARSSVLVRMKDGDDGDSPLFFFPGSAGSLSELTPLVARIRSPMPVYCVKPRGAYPGENPHDRIDDMVEYALDEIKSVAQGGAYFLVGYSGGGLVAFETARRLSSCGASVPLLVLLDTYTSELSWPIGCQLQVLVRHFVHRMNELRATPLAEINSFIKERGRGILNYFWRISLGLRRWQRSEVLTVAQRLHYAMVAAVAHYRPGYFSGKITFFRPDKIGMQPRDPKRVWRKFAQELEVHIVPGSHISMISQVDALADELSACLDRAIDHVPLPSACGCAPRLPDQMASPSTHDLPMSSRR